MSPPISSGLCRRNETWFMEGKLIPDFHYVLLADDLSDVGAKVSHYLSHPHEARAIIANANGWVAQFLDEQREDYSGGGC